MVCLLYDDTIGRNVYGFPDLRSLGGQYRHPYASIIENIEDVYVCCKDMPQCST